MTKRIFRSIFLVAMAVLLAATALIMGVVHTYFTKVQLHQLRIETALAAQAAANEGVAYFESLDAVDCRITWIDRDGTVLFDNRLDRDTMENHLERQEVVDALKTGCGESVRYSDTLMERYVYAAQRLPDGTVLRLAASQDSVLRLALHMAEYILAVIVLTGLLTYLLSRRLSRRIVRPLNNLNLDQPLANRDYEEILPLLQRLDTQQAQLREQTIELKQKQKEFSTVTRSLSEGLVLMSAGRTILSINPAAAKLLDVTQNCLGADFFVANRNKNIAALVERALAGEKQEETIALADGAYLAAATPVRSEGTQFGVALLLFDVTQKQRSEQLRREFTANVSHELKTPLQVISGYGELLSSGMVPPADIPRFTGKIYQESQRLMRLLEDLLRLSRLDEGADDLQWTDVDLSGAVRQALAEISAQAELGNIRLMQEGAAPSVRSIRQLVDAIVFNLVENAVKYTPSGGSVTVRVEELEAETLLTVADTGIGIPAEDQARVFERFYRVDKSRSRAVGGTGLGLSIVKHAAAILGVRITMESAPNAGTTVRAAFPKSSGRP